MSSLEEWLVLMNLEVNGLKLGCVHPKLKCFYHY